jgi:thioredoxin 1
VAAETPQRQKGDRVASSSIQDITDASFESDVLQATDPVLVDCWATWCGPCKALSPLLDEASETYAGRLRIVKLNVDENRLAPARMGVRGVPTLALYRGGVLRATKVGGVTKAQLNAFIDAQL